DIAGIRSKLDYLAELGIDAIWLSPVFCSPQDDNGYDISDYRDIDPLFGSLEEMDALIREAKDRGIRILMDLVLNHSSDEHRWFREARKSRDNPYHDFYIWRDGTEGCPPNDMRASFGGSAWEWVPELEQYYFHQYSVKQPDLNWENPRLRRELYDTINWWTARGVGGFRLDVVDHLGKDPDRGIKTNGPRLHEFIREMSAACFQKGDLVTVGEAWSVTPETARLYSAPDGSELSMIFGFEHMKLDQAPGKEKWDVIPLDFRALKAIFARWQTELRGRGWNSLFWENHDLPRSVSHLADDGEYRVESAKMLAILLHGMQGTPYIYQGEELGMTNVRLPLEAYQDLEIRNMIRERREKGWSDGQIGDAIFAKGRDNARTPMQWDAGINAGFTRGRPWLPVNPNHREINAADQVGRPDSVFSCYQRLIRLRKTCPVLREGDFTLLLPEDGDIFAYRRESEGEALLVVANFHGGTVDDPLYAREAEGELLVSSYSDGACLPVLRPYEARMIRLSRP
ncbi:MAG: alpha-glucosidase, partial [Oscillospiraceae bacterium]|nr:alpha-glucosidase [Oscillospiraceae bacterium]